MQPTKGPLCDPNLRSLCAPKLSPLNQVENTHLLVFSQACSSKVYTYEVTLCVASILTRAQPREVTGLATSLSISLTSPLIPDVHCSALPLPIHSCCSLGSACNFSALRMLTVEGEAKSGQFGPCYCRGHQVRMLRWIDRGKNGVKESPKLQFIQASN